MNQDVGKKIKNICQTIEVIQIICCCLFGLLFIILGAKVVPSAKVFFILLGLIIAGLGSLQCWMRGLTLYAYGEIADRIVGIEETVSGGKNATGKTVHEEITTDGRNIASETTREKVVTGRSAVSKKSYKAEEDPELELWRCPSCGMWNSNKSDSCSQCGRKKE